MNYGIYHGKNVFITGASGGIGAALALKFAEHGCNLFLTGRNKTALIKLADKIKRVPTSGEIVYGLGDLRNLRDIEKVIALARKQLGKIDILVNCAGVFYQQSLSKTTRQDFDDCFNLNVRAMFLLSKEFATDMAKSKWGRIINIGSSSSYAGFKGTAVYCASKHAVLGLSRALQEELKGHNVRVMCVSPGSVKTRMGKITRGQDYDTFIDPAEFSDYVLYSAGLNDMMIAKEIRLERMYVQ